MKFLIYPSVLLSVFLSITGVQGQINTDACVDGTVSTTEGTSANSIYFLLCGMGDGSLFNVGSPRLQFTKFCAALEQPVLDNLRNILSDTTDSLGVTVFAPVNAAFATFGDISTLAAQPALLARIVELHISENGQVLQTSDLGCNELTCAINTVSPFSGIIPKTCIQQSRTKCSSAGLSFQIGPGNRGQGDWPAIGQPPNLFTQNGNFDNNPDVLSNLSGLFSSNINVCNGVVHVVDQILLPGTSNSGSGSSKSDKGGKGSKGDGYSDSYLGGFRRGLVDKGMIDEQDKDNSSHDRRKRLLESLVEPNGNIEQLD